MPRLPNTWLDVHPHCLGGDVFGWTADASVSAVALAWLAAQDTVVAPISSARTAEQLEALLAMAELELSEPELDRLAAAGE